MFLLRNRNLYSNEQLREFENAIWYYLCDLDKNFGKYSISSGALNITFLGCGTFYFFISGFIYFNILNLVRINLITPSYFSQMLDCFWMSLVFVFHFLVLVDLVDVLQSVDVVCWERFPKGESILHFFRREGRLASVTCFDTLILLKLNVCICSKIVAVLVYFFDCSWFKPISSGSFW